MTITYPNGVVKTTLYERHEFPTCRGFHFYCACMHTEDHPESDWRVWYVLSHTPPHRPRFGVPA